MDTIKRDMRTISVAEIYERFLMGGYEELITPDFIEEEKEDLLMGGILGNMPMLPLVVFRKGQSDPFKTIHSIVQGKERIEYIIKIIDKYEDKNSNIKGEMICLSKDARRDFWQYEMPVHYIDSEVSGVDIQDFIKIYQFN
jgi:hypothetical protein